MASYWLFVELLFSAFVRTDNCGHFSEYTPTNGDCPRSSRVPSCSGRQNRILRTQISQDGMIQTTLIFSKSHPHHTDTDVCTVRVCMGLSVFCANTVVD